MNAIMTKSWNQVRYAVAVAVLTTAAFTANADEPGTVALMGEMVVTAPANAVPLIGQMEVSATPDVPLMGQMEVSATAIRTVEVADLGEMTVTAARQTSVVASAGGSDDSDSHARSPRAVLVQ